MGRIGETLKKARELREIDLREISDATKINIRYLAAIETNHFDLLPGGVFNKGFIRAYANYIGLDGQAMVDNYVHDLEAGPDEANAPEPAPSGLHRPAEIPLRRATLHPPGRGEAEISSAPPLTAKSSHDQSAIHLTGLHEVAGPVSDASPPAGPERVLPRLVWLMAATGLLFCILAAWRYVSEASRAPIESGRAHRSQPSPTETPALTPSPGALSETVAGNDGGDAAAADDGAAHAGEAVSADRPQASPQIATLAPAAETATIVEPPKPAATSTGGPDSKAKEQDSPATSDDRPAALPKPESLVAEEVASGMTMVITARADTRVRVICDGREAADRHLNRGESTSLHCEHLLRLSAADASSIGLTINGSVCQPLGAPGSRLFGFVIRADDYRDLCPDRSEGTDVDH